MNQARTAIVVADSSATSKPWPLHHGVQTTPLQRAMPPTAGATTTTSTPEQCRQESPLLGSLDAEEAHASPHNPHQRPTPPPLRGFDSPGERTSELVCLSGAPLCC